MNSSNKPGQEDKPAESRVSKLSAAILRISASLDLKTVLHEVVDSACELTGAQYGAIIIVNDSGQPQDFFTFGLTPDEQQQFAEWSDAPRFFEHLRNLQAQVRLRDMPSYIRSLGISSNLMPSETFLGTPMLHRSELVGYFLLAGKESGPEFTSEDEEMLMLFASQAATAIANARTHRNEMHARADLEALVDTSPVGVVVFDANTGNVKSVNREAKRIVEKLRIPDCPTEQLLEVMTFRRADGREIDLEKLSLAQTLNSDETIRAEEIILSVPDGRSVTTLVNATPIISTTGDVESVVVTFQDLAPLEEMERLRSEFLSMVSHELRAPLTSIKGSTVTVLGVSPVPDAAEMIQFFRIIDKQADDMRGLIADLLDAGRIEAGTLSVTPVPSKVTDLVDQARNTFLSGGGRHNILIDLPHELPHVIVDRQRIVQVLNNLISNASRHSSESSPIRVTAVEDGIHVSVSVSDEGRGVPSEQLPYLFSKYSSDKSERGLGGTGLGLAICKGLVEAHGGRIHAESDGVGHGTRFTFTIPVVESTDDHALSDRSHTPQKFQEETHILVVDDDPQSLRYVRDSLAMAGYTSIVTGDPKEVSSIVRKEKLHLVLLDLVLPGIDGIELMERIPELADLPVIFVSGYGRDETIAKALESGAIDYIVKPFSPTELIARVRAALRRQVKSEPFALGDLAIHYDQRLVTVAGRKVQLTATEYRLLYVLSVNAGRVLPYETLLLKVWDTQGDGDAELVRAFVTKLRAKLGDNAAKPIYIFTERGVGYRMAKPGNL